MIGLISLPFISLLDIRQFAPKRFIKRNEVHLTTLEPLPGAIRTLTRTRVRRTVKVRVRLLLAVRTCYSSDSLLAGQACVHMQQLRWKGCASPHHQSVENIPGTQWERAFWLHSIFLRQISLPCTPSKSIWAVCFVERIYDEVATVNTNSKSFCT